MSCRQTVAKKCKGIHVSTHINKVSVHALQCTYIYCKLVRVDRVPGILPVRPFLKTYLHRELRGTKQPENVILRMEYH